MTDDHVERVAEAGMGAMYYIMGHGEVGTWGVIKEALAMRNATGDIPDGPAHRLLCEAHQRIAAGRAPGPSIDAKDQEQLTSAGRALVEGVLPVLAALPDEQADGVRDWLVTVGERVAEAAKDKHGTENVSDAEIGAIEDLKRMLAG